MSSSEGSTAGAAKVPMSEWATIGNVFIEPKAAFEDVAARPRWIVPVVLLIVFSIGLSYAMSAHVGWDRIVRRGIEKSEQTQNLTAEQRERAVAMGAKFASISAYAAPVIGTPLVLLIEAGVLMLIFNGLFGTDLRFRGVFAVTAYSTLPWLIGIVQSIVVMLLRSPEDFDPQNASAMSVGYYLGSSAPKWMAALAGSVDVFVIWGILLMATGLAVASKKLRFGQALAGVVLPWLLWVCVKVGWAAVRG